jgi:hypothetical protein
LSSRADEDENRDLTVKNRLQQAVKCDERFLVSSVFCKENESLPSEGELQRLVVELEKYQETGEEESRYCICQLITLLQIYRRYLIYQQNVPNMVLRSIQS